MFFTIPVDSFDLGGLVRRCLEDEERVGDVNRDLLSILKRGVDHNVLSLEIHACLAVALTSHAGTNKGLRIAKSSDSCLVTGTTYKSNPRFWKKLEDFATDAG